MPSNNLLTGLGQSSHTPPTAKPPAPAARPEPAATPFAKQPVPANIPKIPAANPKYETIDTSSAPVSLISAPPAAAQNEIMDVVVEDDDINTQGLNEDELQMLFEVHTGKYVSIHDFEMNVQPADSTTYFDKNAVTTTTFQTIS